MLRRRDFMKWLLIFSAALHLCVSPLFAADKPFIPDPAKFAPMAKARHLSGELVYMDAVNRRGGIRIDGGESGRYWAGPIHYFALLPYATIWQNGRFARSWHKAAARSNESARPSSDRFHPHQFECPHGGSPRPCKPAPRRDVAPSPSARTWPDRE